MSALRGESGWKAVHHKHFGKERWDELRKALKAPVTHVCVVNSFLPTQTQAQIRQDLGLRECCVPLPFIAATASAAEPLDDAEAGDDLQIGAGAIHDGSDGPPREALSLSHYFLDGASVLAPRLLMPEPQDTILDLCAAPGGKSLVLASMMFPCQIGGEVAGRLVCNEPSRPRSQRLQRIVTSFLPSELLQPRPPQAANVSFSTVDVCQESPSALNRYGPFSKVLVDAPCSSDRHLVLKGKAELSRWAPGVVKSNADRQLCLLEAAASVLRPGGAIVYSTCALSPTENDGVVGKFLKRLRGQFEIDKDALADSVTLLQGIDETECGIMVLPDRTQYGPLFLTRLRRC
eukprot:gnl/MRDRNA2_/MRDRNA2_153596_c0_seq1.p1 gnl/MRDRNA2_/MRDRNA2_153596_c0~~gnl/MRDRNA2_/MRDRNA2_153596_c0_seq1.p1  ORF type:complete len:362 (+),score=61.69 gnl/MRDRNA2_/MRDRNA2_153596_c0_seq1:47-1087(+)